MTKTHFFSRPLVLFFAFLLSFQLAFASGIGGQPANPLDPDNSGWFMYQLSPGTTYDDVLIVTNSSTQAWDVVIYPADSIPSSGGGFALKQRVDEMIEMGDWVKLSTTELTMQPGEEKRIPFTITIPEDAEVGETAGAIMFEKFDPNTGDEDIIQEGSGVKISLRTGVRIYNTVPGEVSEKLSLVDMAVNQKIDANQKSYIINTQVSNTGNTSITAIYKTTITDAFTNAVVKESESEFLIARGTTFENNFEWNDVPSFGKFNVNINVTAKLKNGSKQPIGVKEITIYVIPYFEISIALAILILLIGFTIYRRRKYSSKGWVDYQAKAGDDLMSIAEAHKIDWQVLAKVNNLKPPYLIAEGTSIIVPPTSSMAE